MYVHERNIQFQTQHFELPACFGNQRICERDDPILVISTGEILRSSIDIKCWNECEDVLSVIPFVFEEMIKSKGQEEIRLIAKRNAAPCVDIGYFISVAHISTHLSFL